MEKNKWEKLADQAENEGEIARLERLDETGVSEEEVSRGMKKVKESTKRRDELKQD